MRRVSHKPVYRGVCVTSPERQRSSIGVRVPQAPSTGACASQAPNASAHRSGCVSHKPRLPGRVRHKPRTPVLIHQGACPTSPVYRGVCFTSPERQCSSITVRVPQAPNAPAPGEGWAHGARAHGARAHRPRAHRPPAHRPPAHRPPAHRPPAHRPRAHRPWAHGRHPKCPKLSEYSGVGIVRVRGWLDRWANVACRWAEPGWAGRIRPDIGG
jgi:hypothetical protein